MSNKGCLFQIANQFFLSVLTVKVNWQKSFSWAKFAGQSADAT